jgi:hypothetical protein
LFFYLKIIGYTFDIHYIGIHDYSPFVSLFS